MRAIQNQLPNPRHVEIHRIFVKAKPEVAWPAARHFDGGQIPWVRFLFDIRGWPDLLRGRKPNQEDRRLGVDQVIDNGKGFMMVQEIPGSEVVVGAAGKFWHLNIPFADVRPDQFASFNEPDWGKLAWSISVEPYLDGSTITFELRTTATDGSSWRKLNAYYHVIGIGSQLIRGSVMSALTEKLHKMPRPDDETRPLPGDERLPACKHQLSHGIDIEAPPEIVWRYLMQLGCDRGGWYSIDALDHGGEPSIDHLVDGWESRAVGDKLAATPKQESFYDVYAVEEEKSFVIGGETERMGGPFKMTWAFVLEPIGADATHLVTRARVESEPAWAEWLMGAVIYPPIHRLMQTTQLKNIKRLAERDARRRDSSVGSSGA